MVTEIKEVKKESWFERHKFLGIFLIIIGSIILVSILIGLFVPQEETNKKGSGLKIINEGSSEANIKTIGEIRITAENWDADSDIDGLHFYLEPEDAEGGIVETDGTLNIKLWKFECTDENEYIGCVEHTCTKKDKDLIETWSIPLTKSDFDIILGAEINAEYKKYKPLTSASTRDKLEEKGCAEVTFITSRGDRFSSLDDSIFLSR